MAGVLPMAGDGPAAVAAEAVAGTPVPPALSETIVAASLSCPTLNPSRLSAQIMMASGFNTGDSRGVAGLDDDDWKLWRPTKTANRADSEANIYALAHHTCDTAGRLRAAGLTGDLWPLAMAAETSGLTAVTRAKGIPDAARVYVNRLEAYARWYADQQPFRIDAKAAQSSPSAPIPVPEAYVAAIRKAGSVCPAVPPPLVAAQLMAASKFDANLRSPEGNQGIAQFSPELWSQYRATASASVWNPNDAIPALGMAMCDLGAQLTDLNGAEPYRLALAAFQWGDMAVRAAGGVPRANVPQLADTTPRYVSAYEKDTRLGGGPAKPGSSPTPASPSPSPAMTPTPTGASPGAVPPAGGGSQGQGTSTTSPSPAAGSPQAPPATIAGLRVGQKYKLLNDHTNSVAELPDQDTNKSVGAHVQLWLKRDQADQYWKVTAAPAAGYIVFVNTFSGHALGLESGGTWDGAKVLQVKLNPADPTQQWYLQDAGGGKWFIRNHATGKTLDILGDDLGPVSDGTWNGKWVEQWDIVPGQRDQLWSFIQ
ncbi:RICIN domain-containing protein [Micromonospora sp. NPDC005172]|uniref:RICIN domain-containing protein n=1 Tax=Micromonospora sp. NPDC005172 TaxID=3156867 RepID=UPI0033ABE7AC